MPSDHQLRKLNENWISSKLNDTICKLHTGYMQITQATWEFHTSLRKLCDTFAAARATSQKCQVNKMIIETKTI